MPYRHPVAPGLDTTPSAVAEAGPSWAKTAAASLLLAALLGCGSGVRTLVSSTSTPTGSAPQAVKSGPQLGYIWSDQSHTLRPVLGVPGATQLGESLVTEGVYTAGAASALTSLALLQETDGALDLLALPSGSPVRLAATVPAGVTLRFAPSGNAAIAFLPGSASVTLLTSLLTTPTPTTITFPAAIADAAVSDAASVAAALSQSGSTLVRTTTASGASNLAATLGKFGGMSFAGTGEDLLLADAAANTLTLVHNSTSAPSATILPNAGLLNAPLGVGVSRDAHWAVLANSGDTNIVRIDLTAASAPQRLACLCTPAFVSPLSGTGVFRVTTADNGPAWMLDASPATPRLLFIPASASAAAQKAGSN